jgi:hypothetical protein
VEIEAGALIPVPCPALSAGDEREIFVEKL